MTSARRAFLSIGEVLAQLRAEFPDVTISKIRFLEAEGLIEPERTSSGYRKFSRDDVSRLRYVLSAQRDRYLPLRVIKQHLEAIDRGLEPAPLPDAAPQVPSSLTAGDGGPTADTFVRDVAEVRLTRDELVRSAGVTGDELAQLEQFGLVSTRAGSSLYDGDSLLIAKTVAEMRKFGLEPRHLRQFKTSADREIGLFEQVTLPIVRQRNPEARARAEETTRELAALSVRLHTALVRAGLRSSIR